MPSNLTKTGKLRIRFSGLAEAVGIANTYFYIFRKLNDAYRGPFKKELYRSFEFWGYTLRAYYELTLVYLGRVYDKRPKSDSFHLLLFVQDIDKANLSPVQSGERSRDIEFLEKDASVVKLRKWRNNILAHSSVDLLEGGLDEFLKSNPLSRPEIQSLIDNAFSILERWEGQYIESPPNDSVPTSIRKLARGRDDYEFILDSLQFRMRHIRDDLRRE